MILRWKLFISHLAVAILVAVASGVSFWVSRSVNVQAARLTESSILEMGATLDMELALERSSAAARQLVSTPQPSESSAAVVPQFLAALAEFELELKTAREATQNAVQLAQESGTPQIVEGEKQELEWLDQLAERFPRYRQLTSEFLGLVPRDTSAARRFFHEVLEPYVHRDLHPLIDSIRDDSRDELGEGIATIYSKITATNWILVIVSFFALTVAVVFSIVIARSISRPIESLKDAAVRIGKGDLDARAVVYSKDELGLLARALNQMTGDLSKTTVSKSYLDNVLDSMAPLILIDASYKIVRLNQAAADLLGYDEPTPLLGKPFKQICTSAATAEKRVTTQLRTVGEHTSIEDSLIHKDGSEIPVSFSGAALRGGQDQILGYVCIAQDLRVQKKIEERIRAALEEKELLLKEVHHRVKNNLQLVSSLLDLQSGYLRDAEVINQFRESKDRIRSIAIIHEQLYRSTTIANIDLSNYFAQLTDHLFHSFGVDAGRIGLRIKAENLQLDMDRAIACGMIVNELVSNSLKHAFPSAASGEVRVQLSSNAARQVSLIVADDGCGMNENPDLASPETLGLSIVATLTKQLGGEIRVHSNGGTEFHIGFPLAPAQSAEHEARHVS